MGVEADMFDFVTSTSVGREFFHELSLTLRINRNQNLDTENVRACTYSISPIIKSSVSLRVRSEKLLLKSKYK